jgi:cyclohexyl-isocyanide hydratase
VTDDSVEFGLLVFQNVQQLDLTGPYEVFASWPRARVRLVAKTLEPVVSSTGLVLKPDISFENAPQFDVVCVPGGSGINASWMMRRRSPSCVFRPKAPGL